MKLRKVLLGLALAGLVFSLPAPALAYEHFLPEAMGFIWKTNDLGKLSVGMGKAEVLAAVPGLTPSEGYDENGNRVDSYSAYRQYDVRPYKVMVDGQELLAPAADYQERVDCQFNGDRLSGISLMYGFYAHSDDTPERRARAKGEAGQFYGLLAVALEKAYGPASDEEVDEKGLPMKFWDFPGGSIALTCWQDAGPDPGGGEPYLEFWSVTVQKHKRA